MIARDDLVRACDALLDAPRFKDYTLNGLQVAGRDRVGRVMSGVTACQALLDEAVAWQADLLLVHHGYFWKNEPVAITGMKRRRLHTLLVNDINLLAYHLPLDAHGELGNNAELARRLGFVVEGCADGELGEGLVWLGSLSSPCGIAALARQLEEVLARPPLLIEAPEAGQVRRVAWCAGGAQDMILQAHAAGADAFGSGASENNSSPCAYGIISSSALWNFSSGLFTSAIFSLL